MTPNSTLPPLEMTPLPRPLKESAANPESGSLAGRTFKDWTQYPSTICGVTNGGLAIAFLIGALVVTIIMDNSTTKYGLMSAGYSLAVFFTLNSGAQFLSCLRVMQLKPEKDLENQIGTLGTRNGELEAENQKLRGHEVDLTKLLEEYKGQKESHEALSLRVQKMLEDKIGEFTALQQKFVENQQHLDRIQQAFEEFKQKTNEAQKEIIKIAEHSNELRKKLQELGIITKTLEKQDEIWDENYQQISSGVDEFTKQNLQMSKLQEELKKQVDLMAQFLDLISEMAEKIRSSAAKLDESDDKLLAASQHLESVVKEKERQDKILNSLQSRYVEQKQTLLVLKETLVKLDEGKAQFANVIKLIDAALNIRMKDDL